ncbi:SGNH/GDSL hydrolase family protein [Paenibacillus chungangensis]|uniref:SGNH/GDSL hydrolase family protein n=1 Tax=Paenibacillus chungangensis TaxID=696535 RepID=A0ABW3HSY6_9BACL
MLNWIAVSGGSGRMRIHGLPWLEENGGRLARLPERAEAAGRLPNKVLALGRMPSGVRLRFASTTTTLRIRARYLQLPSMLDMSTIGHSGIDLYVDGPEEKYWGTSAAAAEVDSGYEHCFFEGIAAARRSFTLYLPTYNEVVELDIGIDTDAELFEPVPYAVEQPVVFYGSSITQGACASRPGNNYAAILSRELRCDIVNMGFDGSGRGESAMSELLADIDASCYVLDFHVNLSTADELESVYEPFYRILRTKRPGTPIVMATPYVQSCERFNLEAARRLNGMREVIEGTYKRARLQGDKAVFLVDGRELINEEAAADAYVDGLHPNDIGFRRIADGMKGILSEVAVHRSRGCAHNRIGDVDKERKVEKKVE